MTHANNIQYLVVVGNTMLNNRHQVFCNSIEECRRVIRDYTRNVSGIYGYGYDDEGDVYLLEDCIMERIGNISYNGRFHSEEELIITT